MMTAIACWFVGLLVCLLSVLLFCYDKMNKNDCAGWVVLGLIFICVGIFRLFDLEG
jgi:hypothetical protein